MTGQFWLFRSMLYPQGRGACLAHSRHSGSSCCTPLLELNWGTLHAAGPARTQHALSLLAQKGETTKTSPSYKSTLV